LPIADTDAPSKKSLSQKSVFPKIAILALVAIVLQAAHNFITTPIEVGVPLPPGTWRSKCGLMGYLPDLDFLPKCTNSFLEVNDDGTVSVYGADNEIDILMVGNVCNKEECVEGLVVSEDGTIRIGGKIVKAATLYADDEAVSPWPFKEQPKLKVHPFNEVTLGRF
jgi:hypothetical protein